MLDKLLKTLGIRKTVQSEQATNGADDLAKDSMPADLQARFVDALVNQVQDERRNDVPNGLYENAIVSFVFNHERMEGNSLTEWQTQTVFETRSTILSTESTEPAIRETANHTLMFDYLFDTLNEPLSCDLIKRMHAHLMDGIMLNPGNWKTLGNGVGAVTTARPADVPMLMDKLVNEYNRFEPTLENIARFHVRFETIHPFPGGNGRIGRAIAFRECLRAHIAPFIVTDATKTRYYESLDLFRAGSEKELISYFYGLQNDLAGSLATYFKDNRLRDELCTRFDITPPSLDDALGFSGKETKPQPCDIGKAASTAASRTSCGNIPDESNHIKR